ncbi:hypothetical protein HGRIS_000440 [Hohenbuehelia grisea]|uniref:Bacterial surface antigen (D15) domain-containing protein n=1 Tax=Hohenbuehelia grisea TaxID=104357 RepID=A0ABR3JR25_9AGAR
MEDPKGLKPPLQPSKSPKDQEPVDADLERLRKWQEERIQRRLRGEYESAVIHLSEVINNNLESPLTISSVRVEGTPNTRKSFLGFVINPTLSSFSAGPQNFESVLHTTREISHRLRETDIYKTLQVRIEQARDALAQDGSVDVVFKAQERGRFYLNTSTELGNAEGNASATARIRNVFGGAETLEANLSMGTKTRRSFRASLEAPISPDLKTRGELTLYGLERDNTGFASSYETLRGLKAAVRNGTPRWGMHEVTYEAILRHVGGFTPTASIGIRECAGQTFKSAVSHSWTLDTRDDRITATRGHYTKILNELAGFGGDAAFYKSEAEAQISRPIFPGSTLAFAARTGFLWSLGKPVLFSDRFQAGGPISVRMFKANGLGPRDGSDSLGGDMYWSAGISLISDIPRKPHWPVKTHLFVNAGRLDNIDKSRSIADNITDALRRPSVSAGLGLIYRFDPVRVEVNFGVPLVANRSDGTRKGLQVGMGLEFL